MVLKNCYEIWCKGILRKKNHIEINEWLEREAPQHLRDATTKVDPGRVGTMQTIRAITWSRILPIGTNPKNQTAHKKS